MTPRFSLALASALLLAAAVSPGQDAAPERATDYDRHALLVKACAKMAALPGVAFKTMEVQDDAMMRQLRGQLPAALDEDTEVQGHWCNGVTQARIDFEGDEVIRHRGRMVARGDGPWKLRRDTLASGAPLPFVLDPQLLFEVLRRIPADRTGEVREEPTRYRDMDLVILSTTYTDELATDLHLAGVFPTPGSRGGFVMRMAGPFGARAADEEVTVDIAFYVDPESALIHRMRIKCYKESTIAGQVRVAVGGLGEEEEEEEKAEKVVETDEHGRRIYEKGLPVRDLADRLSLADFDITFSDHGKTFTVELDEANRELIGLPR